MSTQPITADVFASDGTWKTNILIKIDSPDFETLEALFDTDKEAWRNAVNKNRSQVRQYCKKYYQDYIVVIAFTNLNTTFIGMPMCITPKN